MQKIIPNVWCDGTAEEAGRFYAEAIPGARSETTARYPTEGLADFQQGLAGAALTVDVTVDDFHFTLINAGPEFRPNPSISFTVSFDRADFEGDAGRVALDAMWERLSDGGETLMPLQEYDFAERYGWVSDRYGVSWQLMLTDHGDDPRPFIMTSFLFVGAVDGKAAEAIETYTALLPDSRIATMAHREGGDGVLYADFQLAGQWFTAMDGGADDHRFAFNCGMSLEVLCRDQAEIDRYWDALSAVPEAEQCGWLADRFGVSWQIVPENMAELMQRPGAYEHMMGMHKLVIDDF